MNLALSWYLLFINPIVEVGVVGNNGISTGEHNRVSCLLLVVQVVLQSSGVGTHLGAHNSLVVIGGSDFLSTSVWSRNKRISKQKNLRGREGN